MQTFYILYAHKTARHNWLIQTVANNPTRALGIYLADKKRGYTWDYALVKVEEEYFIRETYDNIRSLAGLTRIDIDAALTEKISLTCPNGWKLRGEGYGGAYDQHHLPELITWAELEEIGGYALCNMCESRMSLTAELKR